MTLHAKMTISVLQWYPWNFNLIKIVKEIVVFLEKCVFRWVFPLLLKDKECRENRKKHFRENQWYLSFQCYSCKSDIVIFAWDWGVPWNYAYSPFKGDCSPILRYQAFREIRAHLLFQLWTHSLCIHYKTKQKICGFKKIS